MRPMLCVIKALCMEWIFALENCRIKVYKCHGNPKWHCENLLPHVLGRLDEIGIVYPIAGVYPQSEMFVVSADEAMMS